MRWAASRTQCGLARLAFSMPLFSAAIYLAPMAAAQNVATEFNIASTSLQRALIEVGRQSGVSVATLSSDIPLIRTPALQGRMSVERALAILLKDSGFRYRRNKAGGYVIERAAKPVRQAATRRPPPAPAPRIRAEAEQSMDYQDDQMIIITASKADMPLRDYAGGAYVVQVNDDVARSRGGRGSDAVVDLIPSLSSTGMGSGRNKLFARSISDGGMVGSVQSNFTIYLGEQRVAYSAPDPNLQLIDIERVEALLGPHGTLYGSGSLAGVLRVQPKAPHLQRIEAEISAEISAVQHGEMGGTISAVANLPIAQDKLALRAVAYHVSDAGYIDNVRLGRKDINRVNIYGGRAALRWAIDDDNHVDIGMAYQESRAADALHLTPEESQNWDPKKDHGLRSYNEMLQPFDNRAFLPTITYEHRSGSWTIKATAGISAIHTGETYFSYPDLFYETRRDIVMRSGELRAFGKWLGFDIVVGASIISNRLRFSDATFGENLVYLRDNQIKTVDAAIYSEVRRKLGNHVTLMIGGRFSLMRETIRADDPLDGDPAVTVPNNDHKFIPSASLSWRPAQQHLFYAAYREGYRHNSLAPLPLALYDPVVRETEPDHIRMAELGYRYSGSKKWDISISGFWIDWRNINYNLIATNAGGVIPTTMGDAKIWGMDSSLSWRPLPGWAWDAGLSLNNKPMLKGFDPDINNDFTLELSNAPKLTARLATQYSFAVSKDWDLRLNAAIRHQGKSFGEYRVPLVSLTEVSAEIRLVRQNQAMWVRVNNLLDSDRLRYGNGNPYLAYDLSYTPMTPRTLSVGASSKF